MLRRILQACTLLIDSPGDTTSSLRIVVLNPFANALQVFGSGY